MVYKNQKSQSIENPDGLLYNNNFQRWQVLCTNYLFGCLSERARRVRIGIELMTMRTLTLSFSTNHLLVLLYQVFLYLTSHSLLCLFYWSVSSITWLYFCSIVVTLLLCLIMLSFIAGAFLIPFVIMLFAIGIPLVYLELNFGQFASLGPLTIWNVSPIMKGLLYVDNSLSPSPSTVHNFV